ncbi:MAG: DNA repair protein RecO [Gemmatimonadota bacterium]|jgi:DNA repair protein RecO (recombination protein O)|nr:DNA repair protein RecO [Gemmatimonadota bacterium]MDQ8166362.1 DNA repair protein RecO [Gemmatimonadota bacterium]
MSLIVTDAIVLHAVPYLESSRIVRLATREAGVLSVVARGARSSKKRFGSGLDLFAEGQAQIQLKAGRDLHTLAGFDVTRSRPGLAADLGRFTAASALVECVMRVVHDEAAPKVYDGIAAGLDAIATASGADTVPLTLGVFWRLVGDVGFMPGIEACVECHAAIDPGEDTRFSHAAGGVLCAGCARRFPGGRRLPADARRVIADWMDGGSPVLEAVVARAHQRLLREFIAQHLPDNRELRAYLVWEQGHW